VSRIKSNEFFKPIWDDLDGMLKAELYTGRSADIVEKYCGAGGAVEKALAPYKEYIKGATTAELNV
jgi:adenylosuccinate lyase